MSLPHVFVFIFVFSIVFFVSQASGHVTQSVMSVFMITLWSFALNVFVYYFLKLYLLAEQWITEHPRIHGLTAFISCWINSQSLEDTLRIKHLRPNTLWTDLRTERWKSSSTRKMCVIKIKLCGRWSVQLLHLLHHHQEFGRNSSANQSCCRKSGRASQIGRKIPPVLTMTSVHTKFLKIFKNHFL